MSTPKFRTDIITLYDIPFNVDGKALSPNTFITRYESLLSPFPFSTNKDLLRYCLKIKGLPFHTEWINISAVPRFGSDIGVEKTNIGGQGIKAYTLPIIHDPSTGTTIAESFKIAQYLDKTYPDTPRIVPTGTESLQNAFRTAVSALESPIYAFAIPKTFELLSEPADREYFRNTRESFFGTTLEELTPTGDAATITWAKVKEAFSTYASWYEGGGKYFAGESPCFADVVLTGKVFWIRNTLGKESTQWEDVRKWDDGKWEKLLADFEQTYN